MLVLDHNHPVAELIPTDTESLFVSEARNDYEYRDLNPLTTRDPIDVLEEERSDRW